MPSELATRRIDAFVYGSTTKLYGDLKTTYAEYNGAVRIVGESTDSRTYVQARRRPKGFVNPKPYTRTILTGMTKGCSPFFASGKANGGGFPVRVRATGCSLSATNGQLAVPSFDGSLVNKAILDARLKVKDQDVNLGVAFAERKRTADMIYSSAMKMAKAVRDVKHGDFYGAAARFGVQAPKKLRKRQGQPPREKREAYEAWLELQYGWMPLLSDVQGAAVLMAKRDLEDPKRHSCTVKSRFGSSRTYRKDTGSSSLITENNIPIKYIQMMDDDQGCTVRLDYNLENAAMAAYAQAGFTNPLEIAWEIVPWSFVVDWMFPIGNYVSLLDAERGWNFRAGSSTTRQVTVSTLNVYPRPISGWSELVASGLARYSRKSVNRIVYSSPPFPGFFLKNPLSTKHCLNAIALLGQAIDR